MKKRPAYEERVSFFRAPSHRGGALLLKKSDCGRGMVKQAALAAFRDFQFPVVAAWENMYKEAEAKKNNSMRWKMMNKMKYLAVMLIMLGLAMGVSPARAASLPAVGGVLPDLSPGFSLPKPKDGVVIVQIFSMYCPYCQKDAPNVNKLYEKIEADPLLKSRVRLVGIGVGNSSYEVNVFRTKYNIRFPLYADPDFKIHRKLGEPRTPYFIGVKINPDGSHRIFYSRLGEIHTPDAFLAEIIRLSGVK